MTWVRARVLDANVLSGATCAFIVALAWSTVALPACIEPPPKIEAIPPSGLTLRVHAFGASATDLVRAFEATKQNNKSFSLVREGGDGEVVVGLEKDSPSCVPPTALCSYVVAFRIRNERGDVVHSSSMPVTASSNRCADLCEKALNNVVVKVVSTAATVLKGGAQEIASSEAPDGGPAPDKDAGLASGSGGVDVASSKSLTAKKPTGKPLPIPPPALCRVGRGARLPAEEAERRAAQVDVLRRLEVLTPGEYDCLRKAYLDRL